MSGVESLKKIALGTVQIGLPYGIANQAGKVQVEEAGRVLLAARQAGVDTLDTAIAYGDSEKVLGTLDLDGFSIVSKLPEMPDDVVDVGDWVEQQFAGSLERLGVPRLYALLLHRPEQLLGKHGDALYAALIRLREQGKVQKIGISIYAPAELDAFEGRMAFDLVQVPFNLVDRRLVDSGWLSKLNQRGVEIHVRSIFMQGLLLMAADARPAKFARWDGLWATWEQWLLQTRQTRLQACLRFALSFPQINRVVVGVDNQQQLQEIIDAVDNVYLPPPAQLNCQDIELLNPSLWSRL